jgi:hypothetical protein
MLLFCIDSGKSEERVQLPFPHLCPSIIHGILLPKHYTFTCYMYCNNLHTQVAVGCRMRSCEIIMLHRRLEMQWMMCTELHPFFITANWFTMRLKTYVCSRCFVCFWHSAIIHLHEDNEWMDELLICHFYWLKHVQDVCHLQLTFAAF